MVMHNYCVIASNDQTMRLYAMEPRFNLTLEYPCVKCQCLTVHCFAMRTKGDQGGWCAYLAWGDDLGRVHLMREDDVIAERTKPGQGLVAVVSEKQLTKMDGGRRNFVLNVTDQWITRIEFVSELALTGMLVVSAADGKVYVYDVESRERVSKFEGHTMSVKCFAWCRQYKSMASAGLDREILVWDWKSGRKSGSLLGHKAPIHQIDYYEKRDLLFSLDIRYWVLIWDASKQVFPTPISLHSTSQAQCRGLCVPPRVLFAGPSRQGQH